MICEPLRQLVKFFRDCRHFGEFFQSLKKWRQKAIFNGRKPIRLVPHPRCILSFFEQKITSFVSRDPLMLANFL